MTDTPIIFIAALIASILITALELSRNDYSSNSRLSQSNQRTPSYNVSRFTAPSTH